MFEDIALEPSAPSLVPPGAPVVQIPKPFVLSEQPKEHLDKLREEIMDKERMWESNFSQFFGEYLEMANAWRMLPQSKQGRPKGFSNTRVGEMNRAVNTLASMEFRMLTAADPFIEARAFGVDDFGRQIPQEELYATVDVLMRQAQVLKFKEKLMRGLISKKLFGMMLVECPFVSRPSGSGQPYFEGTDFVLRSMLQTGFDPYCFDVDLSDYIFTIDYLTKYKLQALSQSEGEVWDKAFIENAIRDQESGHEGKESDFKTQVWGKIQERKQRAGYTVSKADVWELLNYHGKLDTSNPVVRAYWESMGRTDDPRAVDFTVGLVNCEQVVRFHTTPYGMWQHSFKKGSERLFELEPIPYGAGKLGRECQARLDVTQNRMNDLLKMAVLGMWKLGKYAGFKANQFNIKPLNIIELEDITQFEPIRPDLNAIAMALQMQGELKEDFRQITGATSNLQAEITKASATESAIAQKEGIRNSSVMAEIAAESIIRDYFETCHVNNTDLLDHEIWVAMTGQMSGQMRRYNKNNLPRNVGFKVKTTTDKDFRPERLANILQLIQTVTSVRNITPSEINIIPLFEEIATILDINPIKIFQKRPVQNEMLDNLQRLRKMNQGGGELEGEVMGGSVNNPQVSTPMGPVPTSPVNPMLEFA